jgi:hypothetical protein
MREGYRRFALRSISRVLAALLGFIPEPPIQALWGQGVFRVYCKDFLLKKTFEK